jgi:hypothetical protein
MTNAKQWLCEFGILAKRWRKFRGEREVLLQAIIKHLLAIDSSLMSDKSFAPKVSKVIDRIDITGCMASCLTGWWFWDEKSDCSPEHCDYLGKNIFNQFITSDV